VSVSAEVAKVAEATSSEQAKENARV